MSAPIVLLDMDGPLADFDRHFWDRCTDLGIEFDIDDPSQQRHRYFTEHIPRKGQRKQARKMVDAAGWFRHLPVTPGAHNLLSDLLPFFDVWVCTKPLEVNPTCLSDKQAWLHQHFPELDGKLITAPNKAMVHGAVLIDDAPKPEWFPSATWRPVIFPAPFNESSPDYCGLPRWGWDDDPHDIFDIVDDAINPKDTP